VKYPELLNLTLQRKFVLLTSASIIFLMTLLGFWMAKRESTILYSEIEKRGRLLAETLAIPVVNDLIYERLGLVEEGGLIDNYITEIFGNQDIGLLYIAVLDSQGRVFSHNDFHEFGKIYSDPMTLKALEAEDTLAQRFFDKESGHDAVVFSTPLSIGKKKWGTLKLAVSLEKLENEVRSVMLRIVIFTLLVLAAGFGLILVLSRRFIGPITHLAGAMEKAGADFLDVKVDIRGHDELALLGDRFNSMMARIRQANDELKKTHEKLVRSEKLASIGILASGVAHEINNPLGGLFNCLQMLVSNIEKPVLRDKYLGLAREGLEQIENTVSRLLWMSRKTEHMPVEVNVKSAVEGAYAFLRYRLDRDRIGFMNKVSDDLLINFDVHDFQQLLMNLFINALDSMKKGGIIEVRGYRQDSMIRLEFIDQGEGILPENIGRIFDPFFTTKPPGEGTGLGLWLTYEIIRNYGGEITVESEPGKGSRFVITLPGAR
jgi:signal transduction histidine kinase